MDRSFPALAKNDALLIVDVQNDFLPGGALAVPGGDAVIPYLNRQIASFSAMDLPIYATRDWHPDNHCSFKPQGGIWPPHCVAGTHGAEFPSALKLPLNATVISKGTHAETDAYSGFEGTDLRDRLNAAGIQRLFIGGLATDYCVLNTVVDAIRAGFETCLVVDAIRGVNLHPDDAEAAILEMTSQGAALVRAFETGAAAGLGNNL